MPAKRPGLDADAATRKRVASGGPTRTGQACDRCKLRKIRCDARAGGCSPCLQNNTECKTTDRITGRAVSRGHTETIESENNSLKTYNEELLQQLRDNGIEPKPAPVAQHTYPSSGYLWSQQSGSWADLKTADGAPGSSTDSDRRPSQTPVLPEFRPGCVGENYLGVTLQDDLSPIAGTQLSLFGLTLDLADFIPPESEDHPDPLSYLTFINFSFGVASPPSVPDLPDIETCKKLAACYFKDIQVFTPILHKPDFFKLLARIHGQQDVSVVETVMVHMVMAIVMLQSALRNRDLYFLKATAIEHYHYATSFVPQLMAGHQLQDMQALALICLWLRQQPRLGAAWTFSKIVINVAIELGLHRSASNWQDASMEQTSLVLELRKRVFWSLMVINVTIGGKLGRPMPLRMQDFDIELPEHVNDSLPGEVHSTKWQRCSFRAAIPGMKLLTILMQVYATVYSIRPDPSPYEISVKRLRKDLEAFKEQLPPELVAGPQTTDDDRVPANYLRMAEEEIRLILHHPSRTGGTPEIYAENLDICLDASKNLLSAASTLQGMKSLDTTWYYSTDYLAAIFTTLFVWTQRKDQMESGQLTQLHHDMKKWLEIMADVGNLLGTQHRLRDHLRQFIEPRMREITDAVMMKTASAGLAPNESPLSPSNGTHSMPVSQQQQQAQPPPPQPQQMYTPSNGYPNAYSERAPSSELSNSAPPSYALPVQRMDQPQHHPSYAQQAYYTEPQPQPMPVYPGMSQFDVSSYQGEDMKQPLSSHVPMSHAQPPPPHQQIHPHSHPSTHHNTPQATWMPAYPAPPPQTPSSQQVPNGYHLHPTSNPVHDVQPMMYTPGPVAAWRAFADDTTNLPNQYDMSSASALVSLGGEKGSMGMSVGGVDEMSLQDPGTEAHWGPMVPGGFGGSVTGGQ